MACFASHVHRIQQVLDAAHEHGRKVAFVGRSMVRNMGIARDLGYLKVPRGLLVDVKTLDDLPDDEVVLVCTGSQGEPMAALSRMANRDHQIRIVQGDTVILASSLIPGNENAVYRVINGLTRWGANVVHKGNAKVHVSGHAAAGELLYLSTSPSRELHAGPRRVAPPARPRRAGRADRRPGRPHRHRRGRRRRRPDRRPARDRRQGPGGYVYVDGPSVGDVTETSLKDRRILGDEGFISVFVVVDSSTGKITGGPEIHARGSGIDDAAFAAVMPKIEEALARPARTAWRRRTSSGSWSAARVGQWVSDTYRRRPMIIPVVVEV